MIQYQGANGIFILISSIAMKPESVGTAIKIDKQVIFCIQTEIEFCLDIIKSGCAVIKLRNIKLLESSQSE